MSWGALSISGVYPAPRGFLYGAYVYRLPAPARAIPPYDFTGKPLEQIEREYGREVAVMVYTTAAAGLGDLTKAPPVTAFEGSYTEVVNWRYQQSAAGAGANWAVHLMPGDYTLAKAPLFIVGGYEVHPSEPFRCEVISYALNTLATVRRYAY